MEIDVWIPFTERKTRIRIKKNNNNNYLMGIFKFSANDNYFRCYFDNKM